MNDVTTILSNIIIILSAGITLFLTFLYLVNVQEANKSGNRWLGIFMLCIFSLYIYDMLAFAGIKIEDIILISILSLPSSILAPAFYYTVTYFTTPDRQWKVKDYFHLFSFTLFHVLALVYTIFYLDALQRKQLPDVSLINHFIAILYGIQVFYYCRLSWIKLKKHQNNIRLFTSTIENVDLRWLKYMIICVFIMFSFFIIHNLNNFSYYYLTINQLSYFIGFFIIGYFSMKQKEIYPFTTDQKNEIIYTIIKNNSKRQTPKKLIEDHKLEELKMGLLYIMENDKPFLDSELTVVKLASVIDIPSHQLSYLINTGFNENFYQFINRYRIEEAKKLILDENMNHLSFQGIALEVGFKSKSVFNSTFKKGTGQTPSEYKDIKMAGKNTNNVS